MTLLEIKLNEAGNIEVLTRASLTKPQLEQIGRGVLATLVSIGADKDAMVNYEECGQATYIGLGMWPIARKEPMAS